MGLNEFEWRLRWQDSIAITQIIIQWKIWILINHFLFYHYWLLKISKTLALLTKFYLNNRNTISLNKDLVLSGIVGFVISLFVAYYSNIYSTDKILNSALTVLAGFISSKVILLFYSILIIRKNIQKDLAGNWIWVF